MFSEHLGKFQTNEVHWYFPSTEAHNAQVLFCVARDVHGVGEFGHVDSMRITLRRKGEDLTKCFQARE